MATQSQERALRVFVSSTFRDMQAERDELATKVFPRLRRLCDQRKVDWVEIDLRWGVTNEEAAEDRVLPICLAEIDRCRPFFIALLGERYGWVPADFSPELIARNPWIKDFRGRSVTEIEIRHGALNDPPAAALARFYFRQVPTVAKDAVIEPRLSALKTEIRESGLPVRSYSRPEQLGHLVLEDFTQTIDELFPDRNYPDLFDRESAEHTAFARTRRKVYIKHEKELRALDRHLAGSSPPLLVVEGPAGSGKTALVVNWLQCRKDGSRKVPESRFAAAWRRLTSGPTASPLRDRDPVVAFYVGASFGSTNWRRMMRRLIEAIQRHLGVEESIPDSPDALKRIFAGRLQELAANADAVLILDGLDRLEDVAKAQPLSWLPEELPPNLRFVVTTQPGPALDELRRRRCPKLSLKPWRSERRKRLTVDYLARYGKKLAPDRLRRIVGAGATGNPLYLLILLQELRIFGEHEALAREIERYLDAAGVVELLGKVLKRLENDFGAEREGLVQDALSLLWASRRGLTESELLDLLGEPTKRLPAAVWSPLYLALAESLIDQGGRLNFSHPELRQAVERRYLATPADREASHKRLADYFASRELSERQVEELPWQLAMTRAWDRLWMLLKDLPFLQTAWNRDPEDVKQTWTVLEESSNLTLREAYRTVCEEPQKHRDQSWTVALLLRQTGHASVARPILEDFVRHYRETGNVSALQAAYGNLAVISRDEGEPVEALDLFEAQADICRREGLLASLQCSLGNQGVLRYEAGDPEGALALHREEARLCRQLDDLAGLAISLCHKAILLAEGCRYGPALALLDECETMCRKRGDLVGLQAALGNRAEVYHRQGRLKEALALHREEERLCRRLLDREALAWSLHRRADLNLELADFDGALEVLEEQEALCREIGFEIGLAAGLTTQARLYQLVGAPRQAARRATEARSLAAALAPSPRARKVEEQLEALYEHL